MAVQEAIPERSTLIDRLRDGPTGESACFVLVKGMDRETLMEHLKQAEQHLDKGRHVLEHQRCMIDQLRRDGHSDRLIEEAESLLRTFEEVQDMHLADAIRLRRELHIST